MQPIVPDRRGNGLGSRTENVRRLSHDTFDLLVVGGGITGVGIALDAASRGMKVGLLERDDFASGTSSRSSKLVHGGLRYVAQYQFRVTREASEERYHLQRLAPHLVRSVPFLLPIYGGIRETTKLSAGLWIYDALAALRNTRLHRHLSAQKVHEMVPSLTTTGLDGGFVYYDCRTDDARLTTEVLKAAVRYGAVAVNHASVDAFLLARGKVHGVGATDRVGGGSFEGRARCVVAAAGVWLDSLLPKLSPGASPVTRPAKGVHLVFEEERIRNSDVALTLQTARDHRITFVIPWLNRTLVGTTDTDYSGELDQPRATENDVAYLLEAIARAFPAQRITIDDVLTVQAGLRPLVNDVKSSTSGTSREDKVYESDEGVIAIAGGKLTTYRRMAKRVVDLVARRLQEQHVDGIGPCRTGSIAIGEAPGHEGEALSALPTDIQQHLVHFYGNQAEDVAQLGLGHPFLSRRLVPDLPQIGAQVIYAARQEMALTLGDALIRRLRLANVDRRLGFSCVDAVTKMMGTELGWDSDERVRQVNRYRGDVEQYVVPGRRPQASLT